MLTFSQALNSLSHFFFLICPLPSAKSVFKCVSVCENMCTFIYVCAHGVGDVKGMVEFNHTLTDVCGIDLWLFSEHCSGPFGSDINPSYQSDLPTGFAPH